MRKLILLLLFLLSPSVALADWTGKDASGATVTFKNPGTCTSVVCVPIAQPVDGTGAAIGVSGNPLYFATIDGANIVLGALADAAPAVGATGSISAKLRLMTTLLNNIDTHVSAGSGGPATIANGADVAEGSTTDATIVAGAAGSVSAKLRLMTSQLDAINTNVQGAVPAGTNHTGSVSVDAQAVGGASTTGNIAANNTTAIVVKSSAGTLYGAQLGGISSAPAYLKLYNAASATCGSGTPVKRLIIPAAATAANGGGSNISFGTVGVAFSTGIVYCITTGIADADTTAPAASTFLVNLDWK